MALIGHSDTNFGLNASYHNISFFSWDKAAQLVVNVSSFLDEAARLNDKNPLEVSSYVFSNLLLNGQISLADMYELLKSLPKFSTMVNG